jgi:O-antigen/teichoic acid export membrane protein
MGKINITAAFREAVADTVIAAAINIPLNFVIVAIAHKYELGPFATSLMLTTFFTTFALIRKTYIRVHFQKYYDHKGDTHNG